MATYYVDGTNGDNGNAGTTATTAWATIEYAESQVSADDDIWVAPGTYFENVTLTTSGGSSTIINWYGDPNCTQAWTSATPGPVKISAANSSTHIPQNSRALDFNGAAYNYFYDFYFDGTDPGGATPIVEGDSGSSGQRLIRCNVSGGYNGIRYCEIDSCFVVGYYAARDCNSSNNGWVKSSVLMGANSAIYGVDCDNCILMCGQYGADSSSVVKNTLTIGGTRGISTAAADSDNNLLLCAYYALYGAVAIDNCAIVHARFDSQDTGVDMSSCVQSYVYTEQAGTLASDGEIFDFAPATEVIRHLSQALKPINWADYDMGDGNATSETEDIEGLARTARGVKHIGPWALSEIALSIDGTDGNTFTINRVGAEVLYLNITASAETSISVSTDTDYDGGASAHYLVLTPQDGNAFTEVSDSSTATADTLTVTIGSGEPYYDCVGKLIMKTTNTSASSFTNFHSLTVS